MQEEVENKVVLVIQGASRLTADVLKRAMAKALAEIKQKHDKKTLQKEAKKAEGPHGKMTVKELAARTAGSSLSKWRIRNPLRRSRVSTGSITHRTKRKDRTNSLSFSKPRIPAQWKLHFRNTRINS